MYSRPVFGTNQVRSVPPSSDGGWTIPLGKKCLDPRWACKGVTAALLKAAGYKAAGYSADVAVKTEFVGDLPAHLSCRSDHLGRSDVTVAKVAAPASEPSLRKLPRSNQFQGFSVSISVSRSLQNKHEQHEATAVDTPAKQARRKAKKVKRQAGKQVLTAASITSSATSITSPAASITSPAASITSCMLTAYCGAARDCA